MRSSTVVYAAVAALVQAQGLAAWNTPSSQSTTIYIPTSVPAPPATITSITTIYTTPSYPPPHGGNSTSPGHSVPTGGLPPFPGNPNNSTIIPPPGNGGGAPTQGTGSPTNVPAPPTTSIPTGDASANRVGGLLAVVGVAAIYLL